MISRRKLLILAGAVGATALLPVQTSASPKEVYSDAKRRRWAMVVDVSKCTECMKELIEKTGREDIKPPCVLACDLENNVPDYKDKKIDPQWMRIAKVRLKDDEEAEEMYLPLLCNHCEYPPCVQVCLTKASFKRADGIVEIDIHRCIGCRYCMIACPYGARSFNYIDPKEHLKVVNPEVPMRAEGVVEKCTFCAHRVDRAVMEGKNPEPACVEACRLYSKNALVFGDVNDPESEISKILRSNFVVQLRAELGTDPHVYYMDFGGE